MAARELCRLFPSLWATRKGAKRWLEKEPLAAHRDIIRVWGLLHEYRPPGQTSWSTALVRHGANSRAVLAGELGLAAKDIELREGATLEPLAKTGRSSEG